MGLEREINYVLRLDRDEIPSEEKLNVGNEFIFEKIGRQRDIDDQNPILLQDRELNSYAIIKITKQTREDNRVYGKYVIKEKLNQVEKQGLKSYYQKINSMKD